MLGGKLLAYFRWNSMMARLYCSPRQINSASFSRRAAWFQTGSAAAIMTAMMLMPMSRAAMAYPAWSALLP